MAFMNIARGTGVVTPLPSLRIIITTSVLCPPFVTGTTGDDTLHQPSGTAESPTDYFALKPQIKSKTLIVHLENIRWMIDEGDQILGYSGNSDLRILKELWGIHENMQVTEETNAISTLIRDSHRQTAVMNNAVSDIDVAINRLILAVNGKGDHATALMTTDITQERLRCLF
ncbi:hypothetical protein BBOV_III004155 [Babesia bovis T2Bo]|uniref:hypothetical protein n=1 Tax=Babesia bovis T2Bo TaxID=484906 RepID=UPI001C3593CF|nr:hypothetical protein BBOV_III004155 [Babesia bovis T2Bo]KAG6440032.1 hypothetical protein BBOV_III004155 [Babesia bovis T2Bo]